MHIPEKVIVSSLIIMMASVLAGSVAVVIGAPNRTTRSFFFAAYCALGAFICAFLYVIFTYT